MVSHPYIPCWVLRVLASWSFYKEGDLECSMLRQCKGFPQQNYDYIHYACLKSRYGSAEWIEYHISASFPSEENNFHGIEWGAAKGKGSGFVTMIPTSRFPMSWKGFCKYFVEHVHQKWENVCSDAIKDFEDIVSCHVVPHFKPRTGLNVSTATKTT